MTAQDFFAAIGAQASDAQRRTGIPASVTLAQAALESNWGKSKLAIDGHNLFGIKAGKGWRGPVVLMPTREYLSGAWHTVTAQWRKYPNWQASIEDHARFLHDNPRYTPALRCVDDPRAFATALQECGYATDPAYAAKLHGIVARHTLTQYDVPRRQWALLPWVSLPPALAPEQRA
ncbi:putative mannosyl-glycoprotein endo-beta-N-acetylglucosamidase domain [Thiomonas sp. CB3]|nr:putative mannosyl-glycoprotein endo-beta-N-acetylglucosamidase domain [Thiomonas sp. CB3]